MALSYFLILFDLSILPVLLDLNSSTWTVITIGFPIKELVSCGGKGAEHMLQIRFKVPWPIFCATGDGFVMLRLSFRISPAYWPFNHLEFEFENFSRPGLIVYKLITHQTHLIIPRRKDCKTPFDSSTFASIFNPVSIAIVNSPLLQLLFSLLFLLPLIRFQQNPKIQGDLVGNAIS